MSDFDRVLNCLFLGSGFIQSLRSYLWWSASISVLWRSMSDKEVYFSGLIESYFGILVKSLSWGVHYSVKVSRTTIACTNYIQRNLMYYFFSTKERILKVSKVNEVSIDKTEPRTLKITDNDRVMPDKSKNKKQNKKNRKKQQNRATQLKSDISIVLYSHYLHSVNE